MIKKHDFRNSSDRLPLPLREKRLSFFRFKQLPNL